MNSSHKMDSLNHVVSLMDLLDLDEEIIDVRLKSIMSKDKHSSKHLTSAIQLLKYKELVNLQDNSDCENDEEWEFAAKLIKDLNEECVIHVCEIIAITLGLNNSTLVNKSEHLLQQILSDIDLPITKDRSETPEQSTVLWNFKISDSILDTVIKRGEKLNLPFLELPIKSILHSSDDKLKIHFLNNTVPRLFEGVAGYSVLDKIWDYIKGLQDDDRAVTLNVLSSLSEYYLPVVDCKGKALFESIIVFQYEFWDNVFHGLLSSDPSLRKISMYLAKRALDCIIALNKNVCVKSESNTIFTWNYTDKNQKILWDNFFILIDSLEEKQSNIVLPSLQLFGSLRSLGDWLNCAFNIGLRHDNMQVRLKCIQHRLEIKIKSQQEATVLLDALNDINLYDNLNESENLKQKICTYMSDIEVFVLIFKAMPNIKWSPVPFYHITSILSKLNFNNLVTTTDIQLTQTIIDILKVPCNIIAVRKEVFVNIAHFISNCCNGLHWKDILSIYYILQSEIFSDKSSINPLKSLMSKNFVQDSEKINLFKVILETHLNIDFGLLYLLQSRTSDVDIFLNLLSDKVKEIDEIVSRQYSDKLKNLQDVIYLMQMFVKTQKTEVSLLDVINIKISGAYKSIMYYLLSLLSNRIILTIEEMNILSTGFSSMSTSINNPEIKETLLQVYKTSLLFIKDKNIPLETKILGIILINSLTGNNILHTNYKHELLCLKDIIAITLNFDDKKSVGRLRNIFYEKSCEIVNNLINHQEAHINIPVKDITEFIEHVIECGGYGCLRPCLKIMNVLLPSLHEDKNIKFDIIKFINRMWKEIEELKSNSQYNPCIEEFVNLITHDVLLKRSIFNNVVILYSNKVVEYGSFKTAPIYYLVRNLNSKNITPEHGQLIYVLSEILLYSPVPRKDQRSVDSIISI